VLYAEDTGRWCLQQRSDSVNDPGLWAAWGGGREPGESLEQCARRELAEESGYRGPIRLEPLAKNAKYVTFIGVVPHEFEPRPNHEWKDYCWTELGKWPGPMHPGTAAALENVYIKEAFDQPYKTKTEKSDYGDVDMLARLPDGTNLSIMFNKQQNNDGEETIQVEFYRNNSQEVTGEGDAQKIFATVLTSIQKYIKKYKPARLSFSASKATDPTIYYEPDQPQPNPESRAKLYDRLVQRYSKAWGYRAFRADTGDLVIYELSRMKPVAENFAAGIMRANEFIVESDERAIAQAQYMQGECAVLALTIHKMDPQRFPLGFVYEFFDTMPDMYIEPDEFDELDPARQQDIQYNHQNWSLTHAYVYDVKTQKYIDARGSHESPPNIGHDFNATRHNKFPAKIQDLVNVSSYMEWDEAQEKWIVLRGWDALDKAYTPEGQQRAREYAIKYLGVGDSGGKSIENENFADGRNPQDKGDSKRHGVPTKASVSTLRKVAKQGGRKGQLAHWMANMKAGRAKAKRNK
jgi:8-oxo-dGTP pyrophosphatase MutT (NUDIX family)